MEYTKQRLQWLIDDYKGSGATTRDEANLAQLVLDLVGGMEEISEIIRWEKERICFAGWEIQGVALAFRRISDIIHKHISVEEVQD